MSTEAVLLGFAILSVSVNTIWTILFILFISLVLFLGFGMYRNVRVYRFRTRLVDQIHAANGRDINNHNNNHNNHNLCWRYDVFNSVTYDAMMYRFWVPLKVKRWYKDDNFLK